MATGTSKVLPSDRVFRGDDKKLRFTVYTSPAKTACPDVSGWAMSWVVTRGVGDVVVGPKTTNPSGGISVIGVFNQSPALNTQLVEVTLSAADTAAIRGGGQLRHELRRTDTGAKGDIASDDFYLHETEHP